MPKEPGEPNPRFDPRELDESPMAPEEIEQKRKKISEFWEEGDVDGFDKEKELLASMDRDEFKDWAKDLTPRELEKHLAFVENQLTLKGVPGAIDLTYWKGREKMLKNEQEGRKEQSEK